jgi:hypothetical protein
MSFLRHLTPLMLLRSAIGFPTYRLLPAIEMGDGYSAGRLGMDFYRAIKKEFDPSIRTSDTSQSQVTECWQVSEFREFQRGLSGRRIPLCGLLGFRICPRSRNTEFGAFPFCSAIPADSEQQAASMSCFREARCRVATRLNDGFHYSIHLTWLWHLSCISLGGRCRRFGRPRNRLKQNLCEVICNGHSREVPH